MVSKRYKSIEVDRRTWLHFTSDLINNIDNMPFSGTELSSVILWQTNLI